MIQPSKFMPFRENSSTFNTDPTESVKDKLLLPLKVTDFFNIEIYI